MRTHSFVPRNTLPDRYALFDEILVSVGDSKLIYLEFGVSSGDSLRYWVSRHSNSASEFHGFDSFEGLPSDWVRGPAGRAFLDRRDTA